MIAHPQLAGCMAAMAVMGRSANGWTEWKAPNGKTLDEVKRQVVGVAN